MNKVEKKDFDNYLAEARSWETVKLHDLEKSRRLAWWIASAGMLVAVLGVASTTMMATREAPPPALIRVDSSTGIVDVVNSIKDGKTNYEEAVNKFFTQWYVRYREGYSNELKEDYYYNVGLMSVGLEQQKYFASFNPSNPQSPINVFGAYARVKVQIKSTSFIKPNVALVRYIKTIERGNSNPEYSHWAATVAFKYGGSPMKERDRALNPLGYQVTEYRNDPDAPGTDSTYGGEHPAPKPAAAPPQPIAYQAPALAVPAIQTNQ
jgi:type IV secretion system protein VirB8